MLHGVWSSVNTLSPRQNGRHFANDTFKCIFLKENVWIPITIWPGFAPKRPINNIPALVQIMAWRRPGDKPLSEPMMVISPTHICVTRPQWVKYSIEMSSYISHTTFPFLFSIWWYNVFCLSCSPSITWNFIGHIAIGCWVMYIFSLTSFVHHRWQILPNVHLL